MCDRQKDKMNETETKDTKTFKSDYDTLQNLVLPLTLDWNFWSELAQKHTNKFGIGHGDDLLRRPLAKVIDTDMYKGVIFIYDDPILITINKELKPIDTLFLLGDNYSNDPSITTIEQAKINSDYTIQLRDSVFTFDLGKDESRIENSKKLTVKIDNYKIEKDGQIKKMD
jgi:hypothetical protein